MDSFKCENTQNKSHHLHVDGRGEASCTLSFLYCQNQNRIKPIAHAACERISDEWYTAENEKKTFARYRMFVFVAASLWEWDLRTCFALSMNLRSNPKRERIHQTTKQIRAYSFCLWVSVLTVHVPIATTPFSGDQNYMHVFTFAIANTKMSRTREKKVVWVEPAHRHFYISVTLLLLAEWVYVRCAASMLL